MTTRTRGPCDVLGVARGAGQEEIRRVYRTLARRYHPDLNKEPGAEERFQEITEAYKVLSGPDRHARYDRFGPPRRRAREGYDAHGPAGPSTARRGGRRAYAATGPGDGGGFSKGRGARQHGSGRGGVRGADRMAEIELSVEEAWSGGRYRITLKLPTEQRSYEVDIPVGTTDGHRIRLVGRGAVGSDGRVGDLYLVVRLAPHPRYRVEGRNLKVTLPVSPWEAALGATMWVDTPAGRARVGLPAGSPSGRRLRLHGRGLPNPRGRAGDLCAMVKVVVPATLSPAERRLFEQLAQESSFAPRSRAARGRRRR
ncbi:DnaJ C-terminal domain-containing protein [Pseudonocardia sp. H11422]|uniref:DnaJ C-terminal domain-containing protein n=1 Tax=Pseudonocardia sp. H11422 TaxID=2835866 RepID=UPI001BDDC3A9|nr:DnaJ C-terminal domain-containing protein [Pseudonocardia sp. H11422]